jgi:hypothetical protein
MKKTLRFAVFAFICAACTVEPDTFLTTWNIEKLEAGPADTLSQKLYVNACLSFYANGQLSFYQKFSDVPRKPPLYLTGTWKEHGAGLELSLNSLALHQKFEIRELSSRNLVLVITGDPAWNKTTFTCESLEYYKSEAYDLLEPANNTWRKKPKQKETPSEIKKRVLNHLEYLVAYFQLVEDKEQTFFETVHLQTPFKFHQNGISLPVDFAKAYTWQSGFYDQEDAVTGGKLLVKSLRSVKDYPSDKKSHTQGFHDALAMMAEHLSK